MIPPDETTTLELRRTFAAPRQRVFRAWIEPAAIAQWFRPGGAPVLVRILDARVGGTFHFEMADGGSIVGTYLAIVPPDKLVFTWSSDALPGQEFQITVDFFDQEARTEVVLTQTGSVTPAARALLGRGGPTLLDALAEFLASPTDG
jgi:uncharacterized protein YndB with AHSA1/START domain